MTPREINWLRDAYILIYNYKRNATTRELVNTTFSYNNRPVFFYIEILVRFSPNYFKYYRQIFQRDVSYFGNRKVRQVWKDILPTRLWDFFDKCEQDSGAYSKVLQVVSGKAAQASLYAEEDLRRHIEADNLTQRQQKITAFEHLTFKESKPTEVFLREGPSEEKGELEKTEDVEEAEEEKEKKEEEEQKEEPQAPQMPDERLIRDLMRGEEPLPPEPKAPTERPSTPRAPSFARTTGTRLLGGAGRAGGGLLRAGGGLAARGGAAAAAGAAGAAGGIGAAIAAIGPVIAVVFVVLLLGLVLFMTFSDINKTNALFPPYEVAEASSLNPYTGSGGENISQCKFYRTKGDTQGASYKSNLLLKFFQEASSLTGIPTEVLGAFTRVESPSSVNKTDEDLIIFSNPSIPTRAGGCPRSPTGALGIMQIQPPGTEGHAPASVTAGAKLIGKTLGSLTEADYCDVRKSVIMGAGFLLQKMTARGYGDGTQWNPAWKDDKNAIYTMVSGYYGCLIYGGPDPTKCLGPENYGDDVWRSIQACQPISTPSISSTPYTPGGGSGLISCPVNGGYVNHGSRDTGGHCSTEYLKKFACVLSGPLYTGRDMAVDIKGTDRKVFLPLLAGETVTWTIDESRTTISDHEGGGIAVAATTTSKNGKKYRIRFVHLLSTKLDVGQQLPSATEVGEYNFNANHIHVTLQEDGNYKPADLYFNLCR